MLSVDSSLTNHTAICITYFPDSHQIFSIYMGYNSEKDVGDITSRLLRNREFIRNPFILIACFLEIEKRHRVAQVNKLVTDVRSRTYEMSNQKTHTKLQRRSDDDRENTQKEELYDFSKVFSNVKMQLITWIYQLEKLQKVCGEFPEFPTTPIHGFWMDPEEYVADTVEMFNENKIRCDRFLQDLSLLFQKVHPCCSTVVRSMLIELPRTWQTPLAMMRKPRSAMPVR